MLIEDFSSLESLILKLKPSKSIILVDANTHEHCLAELVISVEPLSGSEVLEVPSGESSKSIDICSELWQGLNEVGADRNSLLICLGGGMITDLGGFVASTFRRGMYFIHVPTTVLAMVDAAIGGKNGVNLGPLKNHIGSFHLPEATLIEPAFLRSLPKRQIFSGFAEMAKHALIADEVMWNAFKKHDSISLDWMAVYLKASADIKQQIVIKDPKERGIRKALNFGHTVGHAIESASMSWEKPLLHGEAIALGMRIEIAIAKEIGIMTEDCHQSILETLNGWFDFPEHNWNPDELWSYMLKDKKNIGDVVQAALISKPGKAHIEEIIEQDVFYKVIA